MRKRFHVLALLAVAVAFWACGAFAEAPDTLWMRTYGGADSDGAYSVQSLSGGGYVIAGYTNSYGGTEDIYLVKTDADGNSIWARGYGGSGTDRARCVRETPDGDFIIVGYTDSYGAGKNDVYVVKTDAGGTILWTDTYGGSDEDVGHSVRCTSDGGYIVVGSSYSLGPGLYDVYLIKLDSGGDSLWTRTYGGSHHDGGHGVLQAPDGGYIIVGRTMSYGVGGNDVWLIKVDDAGTLVWDETYGSSWDDYGYSIDRTHDGGYVIAGTTQLLSGAENDLYLVRTDSLGQLLWSRAYGGADVESGNSVLEVAPGEYVIAGWTKSFGAGLYDLYLLKVNDHGDTTWMVTYGGPETDAGYCLEKSGDGAYIIAGWTASFGEGNTDLWLVKTQPDLAAIEAGNTSPEAWLIARVSPNPSHGRAELLWSLPHPCQARIIMYNALGQEIRVLADGEFSMGRHRVEWDGNDSYGCKSPPGIYFIRLQAGDQVATRKVVMVR